MTEVFGNKSSMNLWTCSISVLIMNYNIGVTSYILLLISGSESISQHLLAFASLALIMGITIGQILFGFCGDTIGRKLSFKLCALTIFIGGCLCLSPSTSGKNEGKFKELQMFANFRLIMGIGLGGMYPLVATISRESSQEDLANSTVALVFGPIGSVGLILAPLVILLLNSLGLPQFVQWRLAVFLGAAPSLLFLTPRVEDSPQTDNINNNNNNNNNRTPRIDHIVLNHNDDDDTVYTKRSGSLISVCTSILDATKTRSFRSNLMGSSLAWMMFDVYFFSNVLMQTRVLQLLLGGGGGGSSNQHPQGSQHTTTPPPPPFSSSETISFIAAMGILFGVLFWLGGVVSVAMLRRISALGLQLQGFLITAGAFFAIAFFKLTMSSSYGPMSVCLYACTFVLSGIGPAPTTFLIPGLLFPAEIRATANGISAAVGKSGALLGVLMVCYLDTEVELLMALFGLAAMLGVVATLVLLKTHMSDSNGLLSARRVAAQCTFGHDSSSSSSNFIRSSSPYPSLPPQYGRKGTSELEPLMGQSVSSIPARLRSREPPI